MKPLKLKAFLAVASLLVLLSATLATRARFGARPAPADPILPAITAHPRPSRTRSALLPPAKPVAPSSEKLHAQQKPLPRWARGLVVAHVSVKPTNRVVALTFDDGPWPVYTSKTLDVLKAENVHATFFMIGRNIRNYPALAKRVVAEGHAVGNHTWNHPARPRGARSEIVRTDAIFKKTLGITPTLFRPPYGKLRNGLADVAKQQGKAVVLWSADSSDWNRGTKSSIYANSLLHIRPGSIILLHDGGGNRASTVAALPDIIASLHARGYRFVTVPELLAMHVAHKPRLVHRKPRRTKPAPSQPKKVAPPHALPSRIALPR